MKNSFLQGLKKALNISLTLVLLISLTIPLTGAGFVTTNRKSQLPQGASITDPQAILRYALPFENPTVRELQKSVEEIAQHIRGKRISKAVQDVKTASRIVNIKRDEILATVPEGRKMEAEQLVDRIKENVGKLTEAIESQDKPLITTIRKDTLSDITSLEELMVEGFPFEIPTKYSNLPQLKGRATVEVTTTQGKLAIVVDGYSAPVNGGNFVDLVKRGFYDGLPFTRVEDFYVIQTGDPEGEATGFVDPNTKQVRSIPLEILVRGEKEPIYETTLEDAGLYLANPVLPFNAYGAVALARSANDANDGSSQFFFFKFDTELTPPGFNVLDGRYSVFGYVVQGAEVLEKLTADDKIISAKVTQGLENLS